MKTMQYFTNLHEVFNYLLVKYTDYLSKTGRWSIEIFTVGRNGSVGIKGFNNSKKMLPPVGKYLMQEIRIPKLAMLTASVHYEPSNKLTFKMWTRSTISVVTL